MGNERSNVLQQNNPIILSHILSSHNLLYFLTHMLGCQISMVLIRYVIVNTIRFTEK